MTSPASDGKSGDDGPGIERFGQRLPELRALEQPDVVGVVEQPFTREPQAEGEESLPRGEQSGVVDLVGVQLLQRVRLTHGGVQLGELRQWRRRLLA